MNKLRMISLGMLSSVFFLPAVVNAGAGANINACVYLPVKPISPLTVNFTAGGSVDHCMNNTGQNASVTASDAGVTCASVGYVEEKGSSSGGDTCATDTSVWILSYSIAGTPYSGSTQANMWVRCCYSNHIDLVEYSKGTSICSNSDLCTSVSQAWNSGTQGPLYVIFQPMAQSSADQVERKDKRQIAEKAAEKVEKKTEAKGK